ncbi:hypothetical protein [Pseudomonas canadensis]|uniref:Uncharacterized protein n=1 Tax=Pseudomonas canadensis TaxID=915099 RepID=A0ABZ1A4A2_9PSED|nr:hypothetical protein [Pseudomonas canadensis]WRI22555.1 hypothetical protein SPL95_18265 [Pseudomonas canadensis]
MSESAKHIKNPLTLISLFAGAAELSGVAILPLIKDPNQELYIQFLVFFPTFIIILFFATLNFNHRVLYAPSDYKDEKNFVDPFGRATPEEVKRKLAEETLEVQADVQELQATAFDSSDKASTVEDAPPHQEKPPQTNEDKAEADENHCESSSAPASPTTIPKHRDSHNVHDTISNNSEQSESNRLFKLSKTHHSYHSQVGDLETEQLLKNINLTNLLYHDAKIADLMEPYESEHRKLMASVALTEKLAISKLSKVLNIDFKADVSFQPHNSSIKYVFDAATYNNDEVQVVEVKLFTNRFDPKRFSETLIKAHNLNRTFKNRNLTLHLVAVLQTPYLSPVEIRNSMIKMMEDYQFNILIHVTTTADLESESGRFY